MSQCKVASREHRCVWYRALDLLSYPRGVMVSLLGGVWTLIMSFVVLFLAGVVRNRNMVDFAMNAVWARSVLFFSGIRVHVRGVENLASSREGFLLLFNHSSHMDIPILCAHFPRSFRFGAKIELFKIPVFGPAMKMCGVLPIDRRNRNKVMRVYQEAVERVKKGEAFALAPEGTRQNEPVLGKFKRGPFEFAINAGMDIVPVVLAGAFEVLPRSSIWVNQGRWQRDVVMEITPRVPASEYTMEDVDALQLRVREQMAAVHDRLRPCVETTPCP